MAGKVPLEMERLARVDRICENTAEQDLISEEGMKSKSDNFEEDRLITVRASAVVLFKKKLSNILPICLHQLVYLPRPHMEELMVVTVNRSEVEFSSSDYVSATSVLLI